MERSGLSGRALCLCLSVRPRDRGTLTLVPPASNRNPENQRNISISRIHEFSRANTNIASRPPAIQ
jgi:hypothetical protein